MEKTRSFARFSTMRRFIFVTDLHHGPRIDSRDADGVVLHGNKASAIQRAIINYAHNQNIAVIIDGGDQTTYNIDKRKHLKRAEKPRKISAEFSGLYAQAIGNHDPHCEAVAYGFQPRTHRLDQDVLRKSDIVVAQPHITTTKYGQKYRYEYDTDEIKTVIEECKNPNLILAGHFAFNREERNMRKRTGSRPYEYRDDCEGINHIFAAEAAKGRQILTLHGHEHFFSMTEQSGYLCIVMPSVVQSDIDFRHQPCGLFATVTEKKGGEIQVEFKKITLGEKHKGNKLTPYIVTDDIPLAYMRRYQRPSNIHT